MRGSLAWPEMASSGMRTAIHTAPFSAPFPIISITHTSFLSAMENDSPELAYPYLSTRSVITCMASRAVFERSRAIWISEP